MLTEQAPYNTVYRFLDTTVDIRSDSRAFLGLFEHMYSRFRASDGERPQATCAVIERDSTVIADGELLVVDDPASLAERAYEHILNAIVARIRSHILVHAGVVSWEDRAAVFPAYSGHGKTTLMLELVSRGFRFLSDEVAAFDRDRRLVVPFPRSLRIRPGTLALFQQRGALTGDLERDAALVPRWQGRLILDIERIYPGSLGVPCPGGYVIVLENPAVPVRGLDAPERTLYVIPERITDALVREIERVEGVGEVFVLPGTAFPTLRLRAERNALVTPHVERVCREQGIRVLDVIKGGRDLPDFGGSPTLDPLSPSEATMELLRRFRGGPGAALVDQVYQGNTVQMFVEMADLIAGMPCYRLAVGNLDEMADLVCDLVRS